MNRTFEIFEIRKVLLITLSLNILVSGAKVFYGYLTHSIGIISDGFHSLFDGVSNIIGLIGIYIASHPPDAKHPYGHRKYETVFTIFVGLLMLVTCFEVFKKVYESLTGRHATTVTTASFCVMVITMLINIFVSIYEKRKGEKLDSEFLIADSKHTKSDIYVSIGVIVSLVFIKLGFPIADAIVGAIVGIFIAKAGIDIIRESTEILVDSSQPDITPAIKEIVQGVEGVIECHEIRTRGTRGHIFIDLHILVRPSMSVEEGHSIAETVEEKIKKQLSDIVDVVVHIEPSS
ncbi:MAG: cation diffusion facilitator family transporter [Thermodesulfovibrionales bacterium]|nr:cation diffusion facilitator family transporter [Thermodesulfovibrionales bacterium]